MKDETKVSKRLLENLEYIKKAYSIPANSDLILREFRVVINNNSVNAFIIFFDGMTNRTVINENILEPLMFMSNFALDQEKEDMADYICSRVITHNQVKAEDDYNKAIEEVNFGGCAVFIDGMDKVFVSDVKGWQSRGVGPPNNERTIRGPQEGFSEGIRTNIALVRKILKDKDLIAESISVGERSKTACSVLYIKDIANDELVEEVKRRIENIDVDYIVDSGELEQLIEDATYLPMPQTVATERPDRAAHMLAEGRVGIMMNGSPYTLMVPATLGDLIHSSEDSYIRFPYVNLLRLLRIFSILLSLFLPGLFIAATNYHHEIIPTNLLISIAATRENLPFPMIVEILLLVVSFEIIKEAAVRIPGPVGSTLGIIGGLILGQAAVAANIVSPILIIIVALTGIGSFAIPDYSISFAFRIFMIIYIILGSLAGFLGIAVGLFIQGLWFSKAKSFGVPMLAPFAPVTSLRFVDDITRAPIWKMERRPDFLNTKNARKQAHISRPWVMRKGKKDDKH